MREKIFNKNYQKYFLKKSKNKGQSNMEKTLEKWAIECIYEGPSSQPVCCFKKFPWGPHHFFEKKVRKNAIHIWRSKNLFSWKIWVKTIILKIKIFSKYFWHFILVNFCRLENVKIRALIEFIQKFKQSFESLLKLRLVNS